jgi:hypothetical protein
VAEVTSVLDYFNFVAGVSPVLFSIPFAYTFDFDDSGTIGSGASLRLTTATADITNSSGITVASGATVRLGKKATYAIDFTFQNGSTLEVFPNADRGGADLDLTNCTFAATTTINVTSGTATVLVPDGSAANIAAGAGVTIPAPTSTLTVSGFAAGSDVIIYDAAAPSTGDGSNVLQTSDAVAGTSTTYSYSYVPATVVDIGIFKAGYKPTFIRGYTLSASDATIPVSQPLDPSYVA